MLGAVSVLADDPPHRYAYGYWPTDESPGVYGENKVYNNEVDNHFVAEFVTVYFEADRWIEVGWIKQTDPHTPLVNFYVGWQFVDDGFEIEYKGNAQYNTNHTYDIHKDGDDWYVYIDGYLKESLEADWEEGDIYAQSESGDNQDPPVNELTGHFWNLKYYSGGGRLLWDDIDTNADPLYHAREISDREFYTCGPDVEWNCPLAGEPLIAPYPSQGRPELDCDADLDEVDYGVADEFQVYWFDESTGEWLYYISSFQNNTLETLEPGKYYYVVVSDPCVLTIPQRCGCY